MNQTEGGFKSCAPDGSDSGGGALGSKSEHNPGPISGGHVTDLERRDIHPNELARLLRAFDPIWAVLYPRERTRIVQLLIDRIDYDGQRGKLKIVYSEIGTKLLLAEIRGEEAVRITADPA